MCFQDSIHWQKQITDYVFSRTNSGNGGNYFSQLEFVQDGGFTGGIKTDHENSHLLLPKQTLKQVRKNIPHALHCKNKS